MTPKIKLAGKEYTARPPKAKMWRQIIKFNQLYSTVNIAESDEAYEFMLQLMADGFGHTEITRELIEDELPLSDLMPKFQEITEWIGQMVAGKAAEMPPGKGKNG